jgi:hypothetical protein
MNYLGGDIEANMLLCDAAEVANQKLFLHGAGWDRIVALEPTVSLTVATVLSVPWQLTNRDLRLVLTVMNEDGEVVETEEGEPVTAEGDLRVGRPPTMRAGTSQNIPFVTPFKPLALPAGGYVVVLKVDGTALARARFQVERSEDG